MIKKILICVFLLLFGCKDNKINDIKDNNKSEKEYYSIFCFFDNVSGLNENSKVYLDNNESGYINLIQIVKDKVKVELKIKKGVTLFEDSEFVINYDNKKDIILQIISPENKVIPIKPGTNVYGVNKIKKNSAEFML